MRSLCFLFLSFLFLFNHVEAEEVQPQFLSLKGYLNKENLTGARTALDKLSQSSQTPPPLIIEIDSTGGDLGQVLEIAKSVYELRKLKNLKVIVYIHDNALGPSAILPFLADEIEASLFISWGDIPLGTDGALPPNILRNRVRSFIDPQNPRAQLLFVLADAMSDPSLQVVNDNGWKIAGESKRVNGQMISSAGQTLVVNQSQLQELGLIKGVTTPQQFQAKYHVKIEEASSAGITAAPLQLTPQSVEKKLQEHIHFNREGANAIGHFYVGDHQSSISESTWLYIKQGLEYYKKNPPIFIILELDTPGGEVFAAQKISDALKEIDTQFNIPVVAFINNWAISAGAMLAYSCRYITVVKDGSMGAAAPVFAGEGGENGGGFRESQFRYPG